jgi:ElaB/YqjD/DUF883 family membrane-anchored ribosome-binding protein
MNTQNQPLSIAKQKIQVKEFLLNMEELMQDAEKTIDDMEAYLKKAETTIDDMKANMANNSDDIFIQKKHTMEQCLGKAEKLGVFARFLLENLYQNQYGKDYAAVMKKAGSTVHKKE